LLDLCWPCGRQTSEVLRNIQDKQGKRRAPLFIFRLKYPNLTIQDSTNRPMPLAFRFSRILNPRLNPSTNLGLALASSFSSSSRPEQPELPGARGGGGGFPATIREGRAEIFADDSNSVFYNKAQAQIYQRRWVLQLYFAYIICPIRPLDAVIVFARFLCLVNKSDNSWYEWFGFLSKTALNKCFHCCTYVVF
jgi:hypothetical protein